ncbi:Chymosin [Hypsizygus marmoreus]|uniref:Chymosin n=1 Tax=Hypsizygus marmoreus TaxID=39966 RepID=A0A369JNL8_HYPMA|nr:Chymosin [Hypsizygus marmoreus]
MFFPSLSPFLLLSLCVLCRADRTPGFRVPIRRVPRLRPLAFSSNVLTTDVSITNRNEFAYLVSVSVGDQQFSVILDTGSSDFWIVSSDCTTPDCTGVQKYYKEQSSSLSLSGTPFTLSYLMGSVTGNVGFETIEIGRFQISSQVFALANRTLGLGLSTTGNSGILGLSFPSIAAISLANGDTLLENILSNFDEPDRFFAFKLGSGSGPDDLTSSFTLGELDSNITSDLNSFSFTPVSKAGADSFNYWKLPLQSLTIDSTTFVLSPSLIPDAKAPIAVLDTGTTLILGPTLDVDAFWRAVNQEGATRKNARTGLWEVKCDRGVSVSFLLGEKGNERPYPVNPSDVNWEEGGSEDGWCMGGIQPNDGVNSGDWLLGDVFLRNVYVTHHHANSTHQPLIGLLNMTDPETAMIRFRNDRGPDQSVPSTHWIRQNVPSTTSPRTAIVYMISSVSGFVVGAMVTLFVRIRRQRALF